MEGPSAAMQGHIVMDLLHLFCPLVNPPKPLVFGAPGTNRSVIVHDKPLLVTEPHLGEDTKDCSKTFFLSFWCTWVHSRVVFNLVNTTLGQEGHLSSPVAVQPKLLKVPRLGAE